MEGRVKIYLISIFGPFQVFLLRFNATLNGEKGGKLSVASTGNNMFIVSVIDQSNCHILLLSALLLDNALLCNMISIRRSSCRWKVV